MVSKYERRRSKASTEAVRPVAYGFPEVAEPDTPLAAAASAVKPRLTGVGHGQHPASVAKRFKPGTSWQFRLPLP